MYTYKMLCADVKVLKKKGAATGVIGKTPLGFDIPYVFLGGRGKSKAVLIVQGAIHAREHITARLIIDQIFYYIDKGFYIDGGIYFVPMVNVDGVMLCQTGADFLSAKRRAFVLKLNGLNGADFTYWKANINGVDLNTNFNAKWGGGALNIDYPAPENYIGPYPDSEPETRALVKMTCSVAPAATISYHCKGEEIYWEFFQPPRTALRDLKLALPIAAETGYTLVDSLSSAGGYKDWCIRTLKIPAYTVEVGNVAFKYPFPYSELPVIFEQNKDVPRRLLDRLKPNAPSCAGNSEG